MPMKCVRQTHFFYMGAYKMVGQDLAKFETVRYSASWQTFGDGFESPRLIDNWERCRIADSINSGAREIVSSPYGDSDPKTLYLK